jgi:uncharacterized protein
VQLTVLGRFFHFFFEACIAQTYFGMQPTQRRNRDGIGLTPMDTLRDITTDDHPALLHLNSDFATELSSLDEAGLRALMTAACYARSFEADNRLAGVLIALDQGADYDGVNFNWFKSRYENFVYVDRIVVAASMQGRGVARVLYADLFAWAKSHGVERVTCEVNVDPPNVASDALHAALGFFEVGRARLRNGKTVRYMVRDLV